MNVIPASPIDRLLTWATVTSLVLTLASSLLYTARGWDDPTAALLHILGGTLGALLVVRIVGHLDGVPRLAAATLLAGLAGSAGVVGYGFNTVEIGLGGVDLIDATGVATVLKPLGLLWPLSILLMGVGLVLAARVPVWHGVGIGAGGVLYAVGRIANTGWLAVAVDLLLLVLLGGVPLLLRRAGADTLPRGAVGSSTG